MIEDKLTRDERIRLECLAQANMMNLHDPVKEIIEKAKDFENYIRTGE